MNTQIQMTFISKNQNNKLTTLRISRSVDPFTQKNFRYINRKLHMTVGVTAPMSNPEEWIEVDSFEDAERKAIELTAALEPDFELNLGSRRAKDTLAAMGNRVATLCTRGAATHFVAHPNHQSTFDTMLRGNARTHIHYSEHCPEDRIVAMFKSPNHTTVIDGAFHYVYNPDDHTHWLCRVEGEPTDVTWRHYVSVATIINAPEDEDEDEDN